MTLFQNVTRGSLLQGSGILVILAGSTGVYLTRWGMFGLVLTGVPVWCSAAVAAAGGVMFFLGPMAYGSASAAPAKGSPGEPERMLFLYLRPFELDARNVLQLCVGASAGVLACLSLLDGVWIALAALPTVLNISKEQGFRDALGSMGDFIACGRPGEKLQPVGAGRLYLEDDWKEEITGFMARARLVIVRPGSSPSIRWEVSQVLKTVPPERILFYLRFRGRRKHREREYQELRRCVRAHLGAELPARLGSARYLVFDASGRPRFVREANRPSELVRQAFSRSGNVVADRFRPVLQALGLEPPHRPRTLMDNASHVFLWACAGISIAMVGVAVALLLLALASSFPRLLRLALGM